MTDQPTGTTEPTDETAAAGTTEPLLQPTESAPPAEQPTDQRPVLVVDFGAQYAQLIARRVREASVYSEIVPHTITADEVRAKNPVGIVLSGGPNSVAATRAGCGSFAR